MSGNSEHLFLREPMSLRTLFDCDRVFKDIN
jgi:hypothetical protein